MALMRGRLFAGALFAGALFGAQVADAPAAVQSPVYGGGSNGYIWRSPIVKESESIEVSIAARIIEEDEIMLQIIMNAVTGNLL
jgi:hypothetical protein